MQIKDKIAIVTGASDGIGRATAQFLSVRGAKVVLAARSTDKLSALAMQLPGSLALKTDMRNESDIRRLIGETLKRFGRIDILINNAGQGIYGPVESVDIGKYKEVFELNVVGPLRAMQMTIPVMREQGGGMIVNVSSLVSKNYFPQLGAYASTKYALNALSLTARAELAKDRIIVSVIHPKMTATNFGLNAVGARTDGRVSGGRTPNIDQPEDVAWKIGDLIESEEAEISL